MNPSTNHFANAPLLLHINYFEQGQSLTEACRITRELGADGLEFRSLAAGFKGTRMEYLDEIARALDRHPLSVISFGGPGPNLMTGDTASQDKSLDEMELFYREAHRRFPLTVLNVFAGNLLNADPAVAYLDFKKHGSFIATEEQWTNAARGYGRLGRMAGELGLRLAFETHGAYLHDTLEATLRLVRAIDCPNVGLLWDQVNLEVIRGAPGFAEAIAAAGDRLFYVHLKNLLVPPEQFLAMSDLGGGILNIRDQLACLKRACYGGPICLESPRAGDRVSFAQADLHYLRQVIGEL